MNTHMQNKQKTENKTYVWSFLGRLSHWLLALSFFACYISSFYENLLLLHVSLGFFVLAMLLKKIVWGLIGPRYARWSDYKFALKDLKLYFKRKIEDRYREIEAGHNPASSWFAFLITWIGIFACVSGLILYGVQEAKGVLSFLNKDYFTHMYIYEQIHIILVYIMLTMIFFHIAGVLIEQFYHKTNIIMAMVTGYKKAKGIDIKPNFYMMFWGGIYTLLFFLFSFYTYYSPNNIFVASKFEKIDYKALHNDFQFECSDCHNLFPPHLLPKESWKKLLSELDNHFEEDLELDKTLVKSIEKFLVNNSAENSTREESYKLLKEIGDSKEFVISKTQYWKQTHKDISEETFKNDKVERKSNCIACHKDFEYGILSDINITHLSN